MNNLNLARIDGFILLVSLVTFLITLFVGKYAILIIATAFIIWFVNYDLISYERKIKSENRNGK